jgi:CheY-like chemotaxis protein
MPLRVGWVDDTALIRRLAVRLIERAGHTCRSFPRHVDLLEADREEPFDVIVLQPEDDVTPRLAQQRLLARCPRRAIALASGYPAERLRDMLGVDPVAFDRFLAKPFDVATVLDWLDELDPSTLRQPAAHLRPVMADEVRGRQIGELPWAAAELPAAN